MREPLGVAAPHDTERMLARALSLFAGAIMLGVTEGRTVWMVSAIIEATAPGALDAQAAIERALCPDEDHPGYCPVPWTTLICRFDDLDPRERAKWEADFAKDRQQAQEAGEPGA